MSGVKSFLETRFYGDSVVCAVRDTAEPVPLQDRRPYAGRGGVSYHGRGGMAVRGGIVLLQETEGAPTSAPPESRRLSSRC